MSKVLDRLRPLYVSFNVLITSHQVMPHNNYGQLATHVCSSNTLIQYMCTMCLLCAPYPVHPLSELQQASRVMKAIRVHQFGGPEVLKYETDAPPPKVGDSDVLVRVKAVGVNPVETYIRSGAYARKPQLPFIPGNDCAGVVEDVGSKVTTFKKGDRVFTSQTKSGSYAQLTVAPATSVHQLHTQLSFEQGAALPTPYLTAYRALFVRATAKPGETVLVHGASGGVGIAAVQVARAFGMKVLGTVGTVEGGELVKKAGAHSVFNHREEGYLDAIKQAALEHGIDVIVENAAHLNLGKDLGLLAKGGRVAVIGSRGPIEVNPRDTMSREAAVLGVMLFNASEKEFAEMHAALQGGMEAGWLRPIVGKKFPLENASKAHEDIISGSGALGKMVLTVAD